MMLLMHVAHKILHKLPSSNPHHQIKHDETNGVEIPGYIQMAACPSAWKLVIVMRAVRQRRRIIWRLRRLQYHPINQLAGIALTGFTYHDLTYHDIIWRDIPMGLLLFGKSRSQLQHRLYQVASFVPRVGQPLHDTVQRLASRCHSIGKKLEIRRILEWVAVFWQCQWLVPGQQRVPYALSVLFLLQKGYNTAMCIAYFSRRHSGTKHAQSRRGQRGRCGQCANDLWSK